MISPSFRRWRTRRFILGKTKTGKANFAVPESLEEDPDMPTTGTGCSGADHSAK